MKGLLMIVAAVVVLAVGAVAVGGAATSAQEGDGPLGTFLSRVAEKLGVSEEEVETAIDEARTESIDEAVAEGRLTEEQAERLQERGFPFAGGRMGKGCGQVKDAAAEVLGMTQEELKDELKDGNSLAEVAEAQGMSVEDFKAALLDQVQAQLGVLVADGDFTQEQADDIFQRTEENIDSILSGEGRQHRRPGGFGGLGQSMPEGVESSEVTA
ncbi:MAG: hypothetical protein IIA91_04130 [Chloroflexi bacterium]|nr:hypothetical protein [Chloroflexota bacterium]